MGHRHPNSLKNLRPRKPGELQGKGGNPRKRRVTIRMGEMLDTGVTRADLEVLVSDHNAPAVDTIAAQVLLTACTDPKRFVIGKDGTGKDGGLYPYSFQEAARFCGSAPGDPPFGQTNGQIEDHWRMTNEWWIKFGQMSETIEPQAGIDCSLLTELHDAGYGQ